MHTGSIDSDRIAVALAPSKQVPIDAIVELGQLAARLGYESIWIPETWGCDAVSILSLLAARTERIKLAAGVFNIYSRSATLIAQTAATLQEISGGRFILGLGTSGPIAVKNWHGVPFRKPLQRTREYVAVIRLALSGTVVDFKGEELDLQGFTLRNPPKQPVPIYVAALGPKNVRLSGEIADGWLPIFAARGHMRQLFDRLDAGARSAGRDPADIDVASFLPAAISSNGDDLLRAHLAYYIGGMGSFYAEFATNMGFSAEVTEIRSRWERGDRREAVREVTDSLLEVCSLGSKPAEARERVEAYREGGIALPVVAPANGITPQGIADTLETLAPRPAMEGRATSV